LGVRKSIQPVKKLSGDILASFALYCTQMSGAKCK